MHLFTWNMQGSNASTEMTWNTGVAPLLHGRDDAVCCLQECGAVPASATLTATFGQGINLYNWGGTRTRPGKWITWYQADPHGNRCNLAVVSSPELRPQGAGLVRAAGSIQWRPALGVDFGAITVFTIHAISPGGPDAPGLLEAISGAAPAGTRWAVGGDFNRNPGIAGYHCHPPAGPTYNANTPTPTQRLDWCVTSTAHRGLQGEVITGLQRSDHYPVAYAGI